MHLRSNSLARPTFPPRNARAQRRQRRPERQRGVVLLIALIVLIAMTLAGLSLMRSVNTTNLIAGNLSFYQSAVLAGETSTEKAIASWLGTNSVSGSTALNNDSATNAYFAARQDPASGTSWSAYWSTTLNPTTVSLPLTTAQCVDKVCFLPTDAAGNTVAYVIHRMCNTTGTPDSAGCSVLPLNSNQGGSMSVPTGLTATLPPKIYYRISTRITGPRNTVAYLQTIVAL